ncbi:hypothetical protein Tco_1056228 [Tanacetum coccineum]|uniref:Uncharacterized protein n=1 Tax=Tanacetum coccineum TaxID=301880 RepID=A0ABQ5H1Z3_9ASTR
MEYLVKISKKARILELKQRNMKISDSDNQYAISIKEDTMYMCLHFTNDYEGTRSNTVSEKIYTPYSSNSNKIFWKISNVVVHDKEFKKGTIYALQGTKTRILIIWEASQDTKLDVQTREILDSKGAIPSKTNADAKVAIQEMAEYSQKWHNGTSWIRSTETSNGLETIHAQLNNLGREIKKVNEKVSTAKIVHSMKKVKPSKKLTTLNLVDLSKERDIEQQLQDSTKGTMQNLRTKNEGNAAVQNQGASIKNLEIQIGKMSKVLQERGFGSLPSSTKTNLRDQVKSIFTTIEADSYPIRRIRSSQYAVSTGQKRTLIYARGYQSALDPRRPFLSTARVKIDVYKQKITLRIREEINIFKRVKPASSLIKRVYMLSLRERMELDLEARLMGETLVINRSLDPLNGDYIELNDLNEPFELRRNQGDDLMPTIKEGEVIEEFKTRDEELDTGIDDYPSYYDYDKKIHIDCAHNLKNGDVIFGEPFLREAGIKARWFKGMITIYNGNDEVTYQMVRSHLRFKHHNNEQCNKIPPLLKVSDEDKKNRISHPYQKLKGFYKGVLNLGPDYIRDEKTEEWLTRGHISVHMMKRS